MDFKKILFKTNYIDVEKALPDALIYINKDGKVQWVNDMAADIFETSKMHLLTSNISDFIENALNIISNAVISNKSVITKLIGKEVYFDLTVREIEDGYVLDLRDSIIQNANNCVNTEKEVINREKNNFLLKLSNDLKSPLQSIVGFSQAMSDGLGGQLSEQHDKYIKIINKNSSELMYFVEKLLELSKTEMDNVLTEKKPLDITALVNSVVKFNEQLYKGKDIKIYVNNDENLKKTIISDGNVLKSVIQDILEVIFKSIDIGDVEINISTPDEDYINEKGLRAGNYVMISFSSSALLLSEKDLECMFDPYKIIDSTNRKNVLRAVVLASVKNMVQSLGGLVWVESQILKNTCFNVIISEG